MLKLFDFIIFFMWRRLEDSPSLSHRFPPTFVSVAIFLSCLHGDIIMSSNDDDWRDADATAMLTVPLSH